ncbi:MAG: ATP-binding protein [Melioribacteraceae bacterium]|nr:ATP-binding protein [Melioribacteraceae bacterium]MCF8355337.1 ATP-binding protein [Melioribacteraceae bacterium]MCF8392349.1 ATP-binding protein [Melioribacteraceae bacterium]MCF8417869.1 ATP-binding protein [Melioribacteraceae bacterium]
MSEKTKPFEKELIIKSSTDNLSVIRDFAKNAAKESGFSDDEVGKIVLAVDEACTNVIKHAYKYAPEGEMSVKIIYDTSKFSIVISDEGADFDPGLIPEPNLKEYHKQKRIGGLGMFLMKKLMDEVIYREKVNNKNEVILVKYMV